MKRSMLLGAAFAGLGITGAAVPALAESGTIEVGVLTCNLKHRDNSIVMTESQFLCKLEAHQDDWDSLYVAELDSYGLDLSSVEEQTMKWGVITTSSSYNPSMMNGTYVGVSADAAVGVGGGVGVLLGGSKDSISLQPITVSGQDGVGVSLGADKLTLTKVGESITISN